jgi:hypothetical protein
VTVEPVDERVESGCRPRSAAAWVAAASMAASRPERVVAESASRVSSVATGRGTSSSSRDVAGTTGQVTIVASRVRLSPTWTIPTVGDVAAEPSKTATTSANSPEAEIPTTASGPSSGR